MTVASKASARAAVLAARMLHDLRGVQLKGIVEARRVTVRLRSLVLAAFRRRGPLPDVRGIIHDALYRPMVEAMLESHQRGVRQSQQMVQQAAVRASVYDEARLRLERMQKANLDQLQRAYQTESLKILNRVEDRVHNELQKTVYELIGAGAHVREGVEVLRQKFDDLGLTEKNGFQLETIFRTQTQLAYGAGRWAADQDDAIQEILWGYEYSANGDDRTRPTHLAMDGTRLPKDDPFWKKCWPPNGWNCRCVTIQIFDDAGGVRKRPPPKYVDGDPVVPDKGFAFNAGNLVPRPVN